MRTYINFGNHENPNIRKVNLKDKYIEQITFPRKDCYPRYSAFYHGLIDCCLTNKLIRLNKDHRHFRKEYVAEQKAIKLEEKRYKQERLNKDQLSKWCQANCDWWYKDDISGHLIADLPCRCNCLSTNFPCWECKRNINDPMADFNRLGIFR